MNPVHLAGIIKRIYPDFDMSTFESRLRLQKVVYLMKAKGIDLGYNFRLYLHGPYSSTLTRDGFDMPQFNTIKELEFEDNLKEIQFKEFVKFLNGDSKDEDWLEIASSIHLFKRLYPEESSKDILKRVIDKNEKFKTMENKIKLVSIKIEKEGLVKW